MGGCTSSPLAPKAAKTPAGAGAAIITADVSTPMVSVPEATAAAPITAPAAAPVTAPAAPVTAPAAPAAAPIIGKPAPPPPTAVPVAATTQVEEKSADVTVLKVLVIMGSGRKSPTRLGDRMGKFICQALEQRGTSDVKLVVDYVEALSLPLLNLSQHHYPTGEAPEELENLAKRVSEADCYVFISPEYNHAMSPAIVNFTAHFHPERYAYKPSAIAVYSAGPYGGMRAMVQMRALVGELGCEAVSKVLVAPAVQNALDENGKPVGDAGAALEETARGVFDQLEWVAQALKTHKERVGVPALQ